MSEYSQANISRFTLIMRTQLKTHRNLRLHRGFQKTIAGFAMYVSGINHVGYADLMTPMYKRRTQSHARFHLNRATGHKFNSPWFVTPI